MSEGTDIELKQPSRARENVALVLFISTFILAIFIVATYFTTAKALNVTAAKVDEKAGTMEFCSSIIYSGIRETSADVNSKSTSTSSPDRIYPSDVRSNYIDKQASVVTIDLKAMAAIEEPLILDVGEKQVGIFALQNYLPKTQVTKIVDDLKEKGANVILCIAPRSNMLGTYEGVDAILCTKEASPSETTDDHINTTFVFRAAKVGQVGALSISNSNAFIQKIFSK